MDSIPLRRVGEPIDVAKLALFLASDDSDYIFGTANIIDVTKRLG
ncbi:SDR family oxidoreductase [Neobacillus vireti]